MNSEIKLLLKPVGEIEGQFFVPSYQRGYRWGREEVTRLLEDVYSNTAKSYCLQPVVVRCADDRYEVVDGQQRLTTIYLIYKYMNAASGGFIDDPKFSLIYETREKSEQFLKSIDLSLRDDNIDFWFMCEAYAAIQEWFERREKKSVLTNVNKYFDEIVKIIWYEVDSSVDPIALFTRLNIGKIPLTSAELVKAMFLSRGDKEDLNKKGQKEITDKARQKEITDEKIREEIALQWDNIEKELQNDALWYFLTNHVKTSYQTRIDLILDLIAGKTDNCKDVYYTFFRFDSFRAEKPLIDIWRRDIQHTFLLLKDWFENHELYHKIGYLIASETKSLQNIFDASKGKAKSQFTDWLDGEIRQSVSIKNANYSELSYEKPLDYKRISRLLLLFNVESVRQNGEQTQWFPFNKFKFCESGKVQWTLEHIHAQQSEGMRTEEVWKEWLRLHIPSVQSLGGNEDLVQEMQAAYEKTRLDRTEFEDVQKKVVRCLSVGGNTEYLHSIANLALLNSNDNTALNNSTFDVKRNAIIEMDKRGQYIPFCTKMAFLKYYTPSEQNQLHFWGQQDRAAYVEAINTVLKDYLPEKIQVVLEGE